MGRDAKATRRRASGVERGHAAGVRRNGAWSPGSDVAKRQPQNAVGDILLRDSITIPADQPMAGKRYSPTVFVPPRNPNLGMGSFRKALLASVGAQLALSGQKSAANEAA